ncbi:uncharacterized protein F5891DRAFT_980633 [Suillus fuscotomentosus]|uniref:CxC2-like cysteine cluster KDZ transposase-associated domain-containing protein n=1 Tax=Suillus fuscotomentosus TaxID=1912939 RepID=A0AAD4E7Z5_9AGAM|nr:uncharacterized protein F5891DRAFT_980633 [Suillus fuscotomentosus]KAG1900018.1 hypothetical protein F5891DRAFT_980633 [Suillus fuscotomentosus]
MGKSRARTLAPRGTAQWVTMENNRDHSRLEREVVSSQTQAWDQSSTDFNADYEDFGNKEPIGRKKTKSPNDYLWEWKFQTDDYLRILHEREAPPADKSCCLCSAESTVYRCHDCLGEPLFCLKCCRDEHQRLPFHKIGKWNGGFFEETSLTKMGMEIYLGHQGKTCPVLGEIHEWEDTDEPIHQPEEDLPTILELPFLNSKQCITIVDKSGVHSLMIQFCQCLNACTTNKQLFEMGMFLASFTRPKTAFTFPVLDGFALDNLECGTSAMNYYNKLRRMMSSIFPQLVPVGVAYRNSTSSKLNSPQDHYRELMRVARQWRQLKLLKWNGFGYERRRPTSGELALFCLACPQPGINAPLPANRHPDDPSWLYARSLVMDSNFKAEHLHPTHLEDEVWLTDGQCFMVSKDRYKAHLAIAKDVVQPSECNNHQAVNQANASRHKIEATGIGGCACARHSCFVPHSVVDFQKGKRQMNMDYALCNALSHRTNGLSQALTFYDINSSGEREPLFEPPFWNGDHTGNWPLACSWTPRQMLCLAVFFAGNIRKLLKGVAESASAFDKLNETTDPIMIATWEEQDRYAHSCRVADPSAMDVFEVQLKRAPTRKQQELALLSSLGAATWIASGITIEEMQIALTMDTRRLGRHPTETQTLDICQCQTKLQSQIDEFTMVAATHLGEGFDIDDEIRDLHLDFMDDDSEDEGINGSDTESEPEAHGCRLRDLFYPEKTVIPLPSNFGVAHCAELGVEHLIGQEIALREGQANDALQAIRMHLVDKAVLFRTAMRLAKSQAKSTRAWMQAQLGNLDAHGLLKKYLQMEKCHLKTTAAMADPNAQGQRNATLP